MPAPLDELYAQIEELGVDLEFFRLATQLRPRIGSVVKWEAAPETLDLVRRFMKAVPRPESIYGPLLVRLMASFERYLRQLVSLAVDGHTSAAKHYDKLPATLTSRNLVLTGRLLSTLDSPRDYLAVDVELLLENLASCRRGYSGAFRLNAQAFSAAVAGVSPENVEKALETVGVRELWDSVGANEALVGVLGTKGARATGLRSHDFLKDLSRFRNQLAHGGDASIVVTESQLRDAITFISAFSKALNNCVAQHLTH
jgi:hypothetical protein